MENCEKITFLWLKFHYYGNDMVHIMKIYTTNCSHYHRLVSITKWAGRVWRYLVLKYVDGFEVCGWSMWTSLVVSKSFHYFYYYLFTAMDTWESILSFVLHVKKGEIHYIFWNLRLSNFRYLFDFMIGLKWKSIRIIVFLI